MRRDVRAAQHLILAFIALLFCAGAAVALTLSPTQQQTASQPIRTVSRLVQVNVIVERKGKPVTGLTKDDFTIFDQNQKQQIAAFSEVSYDPAAAPARVATPTPPGAGATGAAANVNTFSNRVSADEGAPASVTVILLDALNTPGPELVNARAEIANFLHQLQPHDRVALYGLSTQLYVIHGFTDDAESLLRALDKSKKPSAFEPSAREITPSHSGDNDLDGFINSANQHAADIQTLNRAEFTANVLAVIANSLMNVPGRKNLVWVSGGFPFQIGTGTVADSPLSKNGAGPAGPDNSVQFRTFQKEIEAAAEAVNNANLAIYPVDARGLIGASNFSALNQSAKPTGSSVSRNRRPMAANMAAPPRENFDTMDELADRTGGRAFYNANDIQGSIRRAIDDSRDTYVLEYYPAGVEWDGTFHAIKVAVKQEGVSVRNRSGYFASRDASGDPMRVEQKIQDALSSPFVDAELGLTVDELAAGAADPNRMTVNVRVDPAGVRFHPSADRWLDDFEILCAQFGANGKPIAGNKQIVSVSLSQQDYDESLRTAVKIARDVEVRDGAVRLRVVVHDVGSGSVGSVDIPLDKMGAQKGPATKPN
jgi:VWFA-related protein